MRVDADPNRELSAVDFTAGRRRLTEAGFGVRPRPAAAELDLLFDSTDADEARDCAARACQRAFGRVPAIGAVTFVSRGTDEDALGVLTAFGVRGELARIDEDGEEVAVFTIADADRRTVPESRLHTALEAALNSAVRIVFS